jgi:hypothetical protein
VRARGPTSGNHENRFRLVQVVENTASKLNELQNAVGLRTALLRHQLAAPVIELPIK